MTDDSILVRASSLTEWPDCSRRWAARHISADVEAAGFKLRKVPGHIGATIGTAVHAGAAQMLKDKIATGELGKKSDAVEVAVENLREEMLRGFISDDTTRTPDQAQLQTKRMVEIYHGTVAPTIAPVSVEEEVVARFSPTLRLIGHMDIAEDMGIDDNKTGVSQRPHHPQYGAYSLLRRSMKHTVTRFREHWIPRVPVNRNQPAPTTTVYPVESCEQAAHAVLTRIDSAVQAFRKTGDVWQFLPNPSSMLCSDRFCPAHSSGFCQVHKK